MPKPGEHKTVQARVLEYAEDIDWTIVLREEAEQRRSFDSEAVPRDRAKGASFFSMICLMPKCGCSILATQRPRAHAQQVASCSTNGHLNFNAELLGLDEALWDYVIVHELLHLFVPNHSRHWKSLMRAHLGNYESMEAGLARHG